MVGTKERIAHEEIPGEFSGNPVSAGNFDIGVGKDLSGKSLYGCGLAPGIQGQAGFAAGLLEKSFPVPTIFDGNLGQQQAAANAIGDEQAVAPDLHGLGKNRDQAGEHAQRNLQLRSFFQGYRQETGIVESGGAGSFCHGAIQRRDGQGIPDASPQLAREFQMTFTMTFAMEFAAEFAMKFAPQIKSREDAARLRQPGRKGRRFRKRPTLQSGKNRLVRDAEQSPALLERKFQFQFRGQRGGTSGFASQTAAFQTAFQTAWTSRFLRRARTKDRRRRFSDLRSIRDQKATK